MSYTDKNYAAKLSIYDLLVEKNKRDSQRLKLDIQKKLNEKLSPKTKDKISKFVTTNSKHLNKMRVIMEGKCVIPNISVDDMKDSKEELIERFQEDIANYFQSPDPPMKDSKPDKTLALVPALGTTQKPVLSSRPSKFQPQTTLKQEFREYLLKQQQQLKYQQKIQQMEQRRYSKVNGNKETLDNSDKDLELLEVVEESSDKKTQIRSVEEIIQSLHSDSDLQGAAESDQRIDDLIREILEGEDKDQEPQDSENIDVINKEPLDSELDNKGEFEREAELIISEIESDKQRMEQERLQSSATTSRVLDGSRLSEHDDLLRESHELLNESDRLAIVDQNELLNSLQLPDLVRREDVCRLDGQQMKILGYPINQSHALVDDNWTRTEKHQHNSIHKLCTITDYEQSLPRQIKNQWIDGYVHTKYPMLPNREVLNLSDTDTERRIKAAERIMEIKENIETLELQAQQLMSQTTDHIQIQGRNIALDEHHQIHDVWTGITPKLMMTPTRTAQQLIGGLNDQYPGAKATVNKYQVLPTTAAASQKDGARLTTGLASCHGGLSELLTYSESLGNNDEFIDSDLLFDNEPVDSEAYETWTKLVNCKSLSQENLTNEIPLVKSSPIKKRRLSLVNKHWLEEDSLIIHLEYHQIMKEIEMQKKKIHQLELESKHQELQTGTQLMLEGVHADEAEEEEADSELREECDLDVLESMEINVEEKNAEELHVDPTVKLKQEIMTSEAQKALEAARNYIYYPPKKSKSGKKQSKFKEKMTRISAIEGFLERKPNRLSRTQSMTNIQQQLYYSSYLENVEQEPKFYEKFKRNSQTNLQEFEDWAVNYGYDKQNQPDNCRDWITKVWDDWFDEVYPPLDDTFIDKMFSQSAVGTTTVEDASNQMQAPGYQPESSSVQMPLTSQPIELPEKIDPIVDEVADEFKQSVIETLHTEILDLTKELELNSKNPNPFLLSRRGAIYRKLGYLKASLADLDQSIKLCPQLLSAYWERHLLLLICNRPQAALDDLNMILKTNKVAVPAYKSRAAIYQQLGDLSLAISNLSQAIRLAPNDPDGYLKRAQLYESNGDDRLALEDYQNLIRLQPNNSKAKMKHGLYYLRIEQWQLAIKDFTAILRHESDHLQARLNRAKAYTKMQQWQEALSDYSAIIHYHPNNYLAFHYRGCLLRCADPKLAIRDLSISLLLDRSEDNIMSYFHRGVLYAQIKQFSEAIFDLEMVICMNKDFCCAHINLGVIYFEMKHFDKAIKYFSSGLSADPTYTRAYACRAEAYYYLGQYEEAIIDINRIIHLYPDHSNLYMLRGDFYLAQGQMELAAMCVRQAAIISRSLGQSLVQQALVQSFLQNYEAAIEALQQATRSKPSIALLNLMGGTQMKAKRWNDAIASFSSCLEQLRPKSQFKPWPSGAANLYFQIAQCYLELCNYKESQEAFKQTVKINPKHAEAFYQQGWCRLRLNKPKRGILDLNKALALDPRLFRVFIARTILFGNREQYTKAILNCNEVLSIEPNSIRAYLYRAVMKYKIKAYSLAIKDFNQVATLDRNCFITYFNRAVCYSARHHTLKEAIRDYSTAIILLKPQLDIEKKAHIHLYKSYWNRAQVYLQLEDFYNCLFDYKRCLELFDESIEGNKLEIMMIIGFCYHKLNRLAEAIHIFSQCLDVNPLYHKARISRANAYMDYNTEKSRGYAIKDYNVVINSDANNYEALINLGYCKVSVWKFKEAWLLFTKVIDAAQDPTRTSRNNEEYNPRIIKARALDGRAIVALQMRDMAGALKDLNHALELIQSSGVGRTNMTDNTARIIQVYLLTNRGLVYQLMRDPTQAIINYKKAILIDGGGQASEIALSNLAVIYLSNHQLRQAQEALERCHYLLQSDDDPVLSNLSLISQLDPHHIPTALQYLERAIKVSNADYLLVNRTNILIRQQRLIQSDAYL